MLCGTLCFLRLSNHNWGIVRFHECCVNTRLQTTGKARNSVSAQCVVFSLNTVTVFAFAKTFVVENQETTFFGKSTDESHSGSLTWSNYVQRCITDWKQVLIGQVRLDKHVYRVCYAFFLTLTGRPLPRGLFA